MLPDLPASGAISARVQTSLQGHWFRPALREAEGKSRVLLEAQKACLLFV